MAFSLKSQYFGLGKPWNFALWVLETGGKEQSMYEAWALMAWIWCQQVAVNAVSKNLNDRAAGAGGRLKGKKAKQQLVMQAAQQQQQSAAAAAVMQLSPSSTVAPSNTAAGKEVVSHGRMIDGSTNHSCLWCRFSCFACFHLTHGGCQLCISVSLICIF